MLDVVAGQNGERPLGREIALDERRADALRGNHSSLGQIEMAGAARQIRENERKKRAIKARADAIETLDREQPKAIVR